MPFAEAVPARAPSRPPIPDAFWVAGGGPAPLLDREIVA